LRLPLEARRSGAAPGIRRAAHAAARLADVVRGALGLALAGLVRALSRADPGWIAVRARASCDRSVSGRTAAIRAGGDLGLPLHEREGARRDGRVVAAQWAGPVLPCAGARPPACRGPAAGVAARPDPRGFSEAVRASFLFVLVHPRAAVDSGGDGVAIR